MLNRLNDLSPNRQAWLDSFEARLAEELAKILPVLGSHIAPLNLGGLIIPGTENILSDQERQLEQRLEAGLGIPPVDAAAISVAIGRGGQSGLALALVIATAFASVKLSGLTESEANGEHERQELAHRFAATFMAGLRKATGGYESPQPL